VHYIGKTPDHDTPEVVKELMEVLSGTLGVSRVRAWDEVMDWYIEGEGGEFTLFIDHETIFGLE
jgi:hypothetical protein